RPSARADLARAAGVAHLEDLPLYDLRIALDDEGGTFTLHEEVWFTNTEHTALREVVFRVYANAPPPSHAAPARPPPVTFDRGACADGACTVTGESPSVIAVRPAAPIAPGGHLRVEFDLHGTLPRIDSSRTNVMAQGMESLSMLGAGESS